MKRHRIVVLGAGFGGLTFCQEFTGTNAEITLIDRHNHHLFQPLLYQVATAGLSAPEIAQPIRSILRDKPNLTVFMREVTAIDLAKREIRMDGQRVEYDYLVLALGSVTSYFNHPEWEKLTHGLKTLDDALRIRRSILLAFEKAENGVSPEELKRLLTIVVIGGGPTGVELAGAFAELIRYVLRRDFRRVDSRQARVILIEGGPRLLAGFSPKLSAKAEAQLRARGVEVWTGVRVGDMGTGYLQLPDGSRIESDNIIWAAGVSAHPLTRTLGVELDRSGRIPVQPDLSVPGHPEVFAIGDLALVKDRDGKQVPGVSPAAMQMARHVARVLEAEIAAGPGGAPERRAFRYFDKGNMATIGRSAAVAQIGKLEFGGWLAWVGWLLVHLVFLVGFYNKIAVFMHWTYSYFTYKRGARIVTGTLEGSGGS
ncbi:MAG: NAD(P)/FAD-dependent oxidoreductase [Verrucomicrobiota bacterium]